MFSYNMYAEEVMVQLSGSGNTNPKVPETSVQVIYDDEVDAHLASPKSESYRKSTKQH
jgi:hypothetical protein